MIKEIPIKNLKLLEKNPRRVTKEQMQKLCKSLTEDPEFLKKRPVLVNLCNGVHQVYAGNQRVRAAKKLGWKTIPCDIDTDLPEDVMKSRVIKDNRSAGEWDYDALANGWEIGDLLDWGFTQEELQVDVEAVEPNLGEDAECLTGKDEDARCPNCGFELGDKK